MDPMRCTVQCSRSCQIQDCAFAGTVSCCVVCSDVSEDRGSVDDPAAIAACMRLLLEHLLDSILDS